MSAAPEKALIDDFLRQTFGNLRSPRTSRSWSNLYLTTKDHTVLELFDEIHFEKVGDPLETHSSTVYQVKIHPAHLKLGEVEKEVPSYTFT